MKPRKPVSRLTKPSILRAVDRALLRRLFERFEDYFASQGIEIPPVEVTRRGGYDFKPLAAALLDEENRPEELVDALEAIGTLSDRHGVEVLRRVSREFGLKIDLGEDRPDADFALKTFLDAPGIFYYALNDKRAVDTKRYRCFTLQDGFRAVLANITEEAINGLSERLSGWFKAERRGKSCEIVGGRDDSNVVWFVISHGGTKRRTPTFDDGKKAHAVFRPELGDVVRIRRRGRELWINSATASEADEYRKAFGALLCGDEAAYQRTRDYFTLEPLRRKGRAALQAGHIDGCPITRIGLREIQVVTDQKNGGRWIVRANNDAFTEIERVGGIPKNSEICGAKFEVFFAGAPKPVSVKITLPGDASYERDGQSFWIDLWLENQGFIKTANAKEKHPAKTGPRLNVADFA